jgi:hypothetical protein
LKLLHYKAFFPNSRSEKSRILVSSPKIIEPRRTD